MTDRVYPSSKPTANGGAKLNFPATKGQLYNATRPAYRPQPRRRSRRSCCCLCCLWTTLTVALLLLLAAAAGAVLWLLYHPHRPTFSVSSLQISQFNLTSSSSQLTSKFNLTIVARNPNSKLEFLYNPISISVTADGVAAGEGTVPAFVNGAKNTTTLKATIAATDQSVESSAISVLESDLKKRNSLRMEIELDTKVGVKIGGLKTKKVGIRVSCNGIKASVPAGKTAATKAATASAKCRVDLRIKIWKWTF